MSEAELFNHFMLLKIAVHRNEKTDWFDGGNHVDLMLGERPMEEDREPKDIGWWIVFGVWLLFGVLLIVAVKKVVAS